jgi:hypothetical protein
MEELDELTDVFCVGEVDTDRWRRFLNIQDPVPDLKGVMEKAHARILFERADRAKCAYDFALLIEVASDHKCVVILKYYFQVALFELRSSEIELVSYQLTLGSVGFLVKDVDQLYWAALCAHSAHLQLWDAVAQHHGTKTGRKDVLQFKPSRTDRGATLAKSLDFNLHAVHVFLSQKVYEVWKQLGPDAAVPMLKQLNGKLTLLIKALDRVVLVT